MPYPHLGINPLASLAALTRKPGRYVVLTRAADVDDMHPGCLLVSISDSIDPTSSRTEAANGSEAGFNILVVVG